MGETIEFDCRECETEARIDSTSLNFITSASSLTEEEAKLCDRCLSETMEGLTFDLSIGSDHTRSKEFEQAREQRAKERKQGEIRAAQEASVIELVDVYDDAEYDEQKVEIEMPSEAKHDLKQLDWQLHHPKYDRSRGAWSVDLERVDEAVDHLRDEGWTVDVSPTVVDAVTTVTDVDAADFGKSG